MKYKYRLLTQSQLGELFGVSSHKIGEWLVQCGLRNEKAKKPTPDAHKGGFCDTAPSGQVGYCWAWDAERTAQRLVDAGHSLVAEPPSHLIEPPEMVGPFKTQPTDNKNVVNAEGQFVLRAGVEPHAAVLVRLLNAAHRHGTLARLLESTTRMNSA